jgi:hypothetical protein
MACAWRFGSARTAFQNSSSSAGRLGITEPGTVMRATARASRILRRNNDTDMLATTRRTQASGLS